MGIVSWPSRVIGRKSFLMFVKLLPAVHSAVLAHLCQEGASGSRIFVRARGEAFFLGKDARVRYRHHVACRIPSEATTTTALHRFVCQLHYDKLQ